jgi:uncharacterized protein (DUF1800 family)
MHSAGESCEKQSPPETQRSVREHADNSHYWMKTPDAIGSVTKKETGDGVEGACGHSLLNAKTEERPCGRRRSECPRQNALLESGLLEVTGAHGTKETRGMLPLKARDARLVRAGGLTTIDRRRHTDAPNEAFAMRPTLIQVKAAVLAAALVVSACAPGSIVPRGHAEPQSPVVSAGRELTADQQVAHALSRLTFGARPTDVAQVRGMGVDRWIARQLQPERIRDDAGAQAVARFEMLEAEPAEIVTLYAELRQARRARQRMANDSGAANPATGRVRRDPEARQATRRLRNVVADLQAAKVARAVASERQLAEVMVDFWENHFNVFVGKGQTRLFLTHYDRDVIRPHAFGKFRDLLGAVAHSPAMLFYLDNWRSAADSGRSTLGRPSAQGSGRGLQGRRRPRGLNENYARELLELHTLGVDGGYTQQDVVEVARALTGWSIDQRKGAFAFRAAIHDADEKLVVGHRLRSGRGIEDGEEVLDILARHPATARHIARKLVVRFVSDSPPPALVTRAAETFRRTDGDIREVVRTIITSPEFFSRAAYRAKIKSPFELVTSALRTMNADVDATPQTARIVAQLGQPIFGRQTPDGWPETGGEWMNAGAILNRINFGFSIAAGRVPGAALERWPGTASLANASREAQVEGVVRAVLAGDASAETWTILRSGENPLAAGRSTDPMNAVTLDGLAQVVGLALGAPEFQRK